jgi:hypothetical protein
MIQVENEIRPRGAAASRRAAGTSSRVRKGLPLSGERQARSVLRYRDGVDFARKAIVIRQPLDPEIGSSSPPFWLHEVSVASASRICLAGKLKKREYSCRFGIQLENPG